MNQRGYIGLSIKLFLILIAVIVANLAIVNFQLFFKKNTPSGSIAQQKVNQTSTPTQSSQQTSISPGSCNSDCQSLIDSKINTLKEEILKIIQNQPKTQTKIVTQQASSQPQPKEIFVYFGANGSTIKTDWTDVNGTNIVFDASSYPGAKAFYFQANLKSDASDKTSFARIFDSTHSITVQGSEMNFTGLGSTFTESGSLTFWSGKLNLKVQIKGLDINLATIENPRIKVVY